MPDRQPIRLTKDILNIIPYAIKADHIQLIYRFLEEDHNPIYFYDINKITIIFSQEVFECYEVMFSNTYYITTDYRTDPYEIYIVHIEDLFILLRQYVTTHMDESLEDDDLYNYYQPYVEDYIHTVTQNNNETECPICYMIYPEVVTFECGHSVSMDCKQLLLQTKSTLCPICRASIIPNRLTSEAFYEYLNSETFNEDDLIDMLNIDRYTTDLIENDTLTINQCYDLYHPELADLHYELFISNRF